MQSTIIQKKYKDFLSTIRGDINISSAADKLHVKFETVNELINLGLLSRRDGTSSWVLNDEKYKQLISPTMGFSLESIELVSAWEKINDSIELILLDDFEIFVHIQVFKLSSTNSNLDEKILIIVSQPRAGGTQSHHLTNWIENIRSQIMDLYPDLIGPHVIWMKYHRGLSKNYEISNIVFDENNNPSFGPPIDILLLHRNDKLFFDLYHPDIYNIENIKHKIETGSIKTITYPFHDRDLENLSAVVDYMNYLQRMWFEIQNDNDLEYDGDNRALIYHYQLKEEYRKKIKEIVILSSDAFESYVANHKIIFAEISKFPANSTRLKLQTFPEHELNLAEHKTARGSLKDALEKIDTGFLYLIYNHEPHELHNMYKEIPFEFGNA
ncbi:hypothetical protein [Rothia nasimurium]|uniref:hypothetical protein n=1 Tax=Rothia nasimurium TaxID=85336 RepID=UPI001F20590E|nr:hypothetical protein [Rothia nasimurium]